MPATATAAKRVSAGYAQVPNAIIENQALLSDAELRLALIIVRRGGSSEPVQVTDRHWQSWTGLKDRAKDYAMAGLREKGFQIEGRGQAARMSFNPQHFGEFVRAHVDEPAKVKPARAVEPKPGARVHPSCREHGCAMVCGAMASPPQNGLTLAAASPNAQNGAQTLLPVLSPAGSEVSPPQNESSRLFLTRIAQNGAHSARAAADAAELAWSQTLAALQSVFPLVGVAFLVRLLAIVRVLFPDVTDAELGAAVGVAWSLKRKTQESEGLFLRTVPEALAAARAGRLKVPGGGGSVGVGVDLVPGILSLLRSARAVVAGLGDPFALHLAAFDDLEGRAGSADLDYVALGGSMEALEAQLIESGRAALSDLQRETVENEVAATVFPYREKMNRLQLAALEVQARSRAILAVFGIPRLGSLYV
jgi:hypothetical protein